MRHYELETFSDDLLQHIPYIYYLIQYVGGHFEALIDSQDEVNTIMFAFATILGLITKTTNIETRKIHGFSLKMYDIVSGVSKISVWVPRSLLCTGRPRRPKPEYFPMGYMS